MLASSRQPRHAFVEHHHQLSSSTLHRSGSPQTGTLRQDATTPTLATSVGPSMDRSASDYSQSGLPSPYPSNCGDNQSEAQSVTVDTSSAAQYNASAQQEVRSNNPGNYSASATPTSEYGVYPASARSSSFPDHLQQRSYHPASNHSGSSGDPSIAAPSPTYGAPAQYSPYGPPSQDMSHGYAHPGSNLYAQPRPDWSGYGQQHGAPLTPGHHVFPQTPTSAPPQARPNQVYSFVPIPGAQQHKRPRRRYEEIERMYKCGWQGCEKAYGTLNHLNAHVTMQSHGQKRTPEEFKEIRKEWKARKKEEEAARKADEERQRQAAQSQGGSTEGQAGSDVSQSSNGYAGARGAVQLPPIGYQAGQYPAATSTSVQQQPLPDYNASYMQGYQPASPYGGSNQAMYNQR
ncbi:C2H2 finger domain transcription factor con7, variant 2 [Pyricularia oryzae]|uniref:C2H2 finger domain transcription factor CON7 n=1 Tax=Pyricularia oryzae (strain 70-15 / ATCC MYA-4617 / FGSC 8958) TaxID=242507 RepID=CON7_PYRO7|nr:RecName: Full=C2H2 finger domain transcription factor CON7 [Pyricularia oryzae 70-15]ABI96241.1 putative transcription factor Con7p [Pyricularia grisea]